MMGSSSVYLVPPVMQEISDFSPRSVLDVGVGTGRYGLLIRDLLEYKRFRIFSRNSWKTRIDGIEAYEPYLQDYHFQIYDGILVGDARTAVMRHYDIIIAGDIIEHFEKEEGHAVIRKLIDNCVELIITTPYGMLKNDNINRVSWELHKSGWTEEDFILYDVKKMMHICRKILFVIIRGNLRTDEVEEK